MAAQDGLMAISSRMIPAREMSGQESWSIIPIATKKLLAENSPDNTSPAEQTSTIKYDR